MRLLCVGRHAYLSEHLCRYFRGLGADCSAAVGLSEALSLVTRYEPHVIVCDCDLITPALLDEWAANPQMVDVPLLAVSLTRRPEELPPVELMGVAGVLYLPSVDRPQARRCASPARRLAADRLDATGGIAVDHRWLIGTTDRCEHVGTVTWAP